MGKGGKEGVWCCFLWWVVEGGVLCVQIRDELPQGEGGDLNSKDGTRVETIINIVEYTSSQRLFCPHGDVFNNITMM